MNNKGADQTAQMRRLICTFVDRIRHKTGFLMTLFWRRNAVLWDTQTDLTINVGQDDLYFAVILACFSYEISDKLTFTYSHLLKNKWQEYTSLILQNSANNDKWKHHFWISTDCDFFFPFKRKNIKNTSCFSQLNGSIQCSKHFRI